MTPESWFFLAVGCGAGILITIIVLVALQSHRQLKEDQREFEEGLRRVKGL